MTDLTGKVRGALAGRWHVMVLRSDEYDEYNGVQLHSVGGRLCISATPAVEYGRVAAGLADGYVTEADTVDIAAFTVKDWVGFDADELHVDALDEEGRVVDLSICPSYAVKDAVNGYDVEQRIPMT